MKGFGLVGLCVLEYVCVCIYEQFLLVFFSLCKYICGYLRGILSVYMCAEFQVHVSMVTYVSDFEYYCVTVFVCDDIGMSLCTCLCHRSFSDYVREFK